MRTLMTWAVVLIAPAALGAAAPPAEPVIPTGGTVVKLLLLRQKSVQKELDLSADVIQKVMDFTGAEADAAAKAEGLDETARKEAFEKLVKLNEQFLADNLNPKQSKRLDQITMQFAALTTLLKPETTKALNLTDDQVKKLTDMQTDARKALADLLATKEGRTEKFAKLRDDTRTKIVELLTDDQKAKVRDMAGPPFDGEIVFEEAEPPKDK